MKICWMLMILLSACGGTSSQHDGGSGSTIATEEQVGETCTSPAGTPSAGSVAISSPAADCKSQICLSEPTRSTCTAKCSADADCVGANLDQCADGFVCSAVTTVGAFACQKLCVCRDDAQTLNCN